MISNYSFTLVDRQTKKKTRITIKANSIKEARAIAHATYGVAYEVIG